MAEGVMTEKTDEKNIGKANLAERGRSGTLVTASTINSDYIQSLNGIEGQKEYEKITRSDSQVRKIYHAVNNPIKSAKWDIEPASDDEQDIKIAALIKHILFNDVPDGWTGKLDEILTFPWRGHAVFEVIHQNRTNKNFGPYTGLKNLAFREQQTLWRWNFSPEGILESIHQMQNGDIMIDVDIPADTLLIFYNEKIGNDSGYPFCRMIYGNYKRKLLYKQLQAIGIERSAISSPALKLPAALDPASEEYALAEEQLRKYTLAQDAYFMLPYGYDLIFNEGSTFDPAKTQVAIKAENEEIVGSVVGMFLEMGIGGNSGNQAGTSTSAKVFANGIQYLANKICDAINLSLIPNLVTLNFGEVEVMPKLVCSGITDEDGEAVMRIVTGYMAAGAIMPDEPLEDFLRKQNNLPKKAAGAMIDNQKAKTDSTDPNEPKEPTDPKAVKDIATNKNNKTFKFSDKETAVPNLIISQSKKISDVINKAVKLSGEKFIVDMMNRYKTLPTAKKQDASSVTMGGQKLFRDALKKSLSETVSLAIAQAKKEISMPDLQLSEKPDQLNRIAKLFDEKEVRLTSELDKYPTYVQILLTKQTQLIVDQTLADLEAKLSFAFSSIERKSSDVDVIKQNVEEALVDYSNTLTIKADNAAALVVNEGREAVFFSEDAKDSIHSYTFMNADPITSICRALNGITFAPNDAESLRYAPPLHHNCKSYLRANLKSMKGVENLKIGTLSPTEAQIKDITL